MYFVSALTFVAGFAAAQQEIHEWTHAPEVVHHDDDHYFNDFAGDHHYPEHVSDYEAFHAVDHQEPVHHFAEHAYENYAHYFDADYDYSPYHDIEEPHHFVQHHEEVIHEPEIHHEEHGVAHSNGTTCWLRAYGRGAGKPISTCPAGKEKSGALCYP